MEHDLRNAIDFDALGIEYVTKHTKVPSTQWSWYSVTNIVRTQRESSARFPPSNPAPYGTKHWGVPSKENTYVWFLSSWETWINKAIEEAFNEAHKYKDKNTKKYVFYTVLRLQGSMFIIDESHTVKTKRLGYWKYIWGKN